MISNDPRVGGLGRKSGSFFSPVLHPWLLKIRFCWKQGVFSQQIIIYSHQPTRVKLQGRKAPFLWLSAQPRPYIQNLLEMKKPSANEIMFLCLNLPGPSSLQSQLRQSSFWVIPISPWLALEASGLGITPAVSSAAGSSLSSSETILHLPPYPKLQRNQIPPLNSFLALPISNDFFKREKHSLSISVCCDCCLCNILHILTHIPCCLHPFVDSHQGWGEGDAHFPCICTSTEQQSFTPSCWSSYYQLCCYCFGHFWWLHYWLPFSSQQGLSHHPICWRISWNEATVTSVLSDSSINTFSDVTPSVSTLTPRDRWIGQTGTFPPID